MMMSMTKSTPHTVQNTSNQGLSYHKWERSAVRVGQRVPSQNQVTGSELFGSTLGPSEYNLKSYTGPLDIEGSTTARIKYQGRECEVPVVIMRSPSQSNLLGRDALLALSMIEIKQVREESSCSTTVEEVLSALEAVFRDYFEGHSSQDTGKSRGSA